MMDDRCDAELANGKRCKNPATRWKHATINLTGEDEDWPVALCDAHAKDTSIVRAGPDRRKQYAEQHGGRDAEQG